MEVSRIDGAFPIRPNPGGRRVDSPHASPAGADKIDLSPKARFQSLIRDVPAVRAEKIAALKKAIDANTYESARIIQAAAEKLIDDLG